MSVPPFQAFLDEHREVVYRFLVASVGSQEADDCFQETFLAALRAYPRLRDASNLRGWVMAIATRKAIDHGRGMRRRATPMAEVPEQAWTEPGRHPEVWDAISDLNPRERAAVIQRYVLDLPYAEVGMALGSSEEAARAVTYQARKKLRRALARVEGRTA